MVTGVGNATLYQGYLVKGYLTIHKKPGVRPISIPHPLQAVRQLQIVIKRKQKEGIKTFKSKKKELFNY